MTPELWAAILSPICSGLFAAGMAAGAVTWRFRALEGRVTRVEQDSRQAHKRIDRLLEEPHHVNS